MRIAHGASATHHDSCLSPRHHSTCNNPQAISFTNDDYRLFLNCLRQAELKRKCRVYRYVLMTDHFHLLLEPSESGGLSRFMQSAGQRYVRYINKTYVRSGTSNKC
jgi:putative transposase